MKIKKHNAFTLAEVLITLGIIGIIAAMTLPQLIKNYQAKVLEVRLQKSYSILQNTYLMTKASLGVTNLRKEFATYDQVNQIYTNSEMFINEFYKQAKVVKKLNKLYPITNFNKTKIMTTDPGADTPKPLRILPDGSSIGAQINNGAIRFWVDTNGPYSKPNRLGFDIFEFQVRDSSDMIKPLKMTRAYSEEELDKATFPDVAGYPCNKNSTQGLNGIGCAYFAINDICPEDEHKHYWKELPW